MIKDNSRVNENEREDLEKAEDKKAKKSFEFPKYLIKPKQFCFLLRPENICKIKIQEIQEIHFLRI